METREEDVVKNTTMPRTARFEAAGREADETVEDLKARVSEKVNRARTS